jgi:cholesterol transport system auxiliary component
MRESKGWCSLLLVVALAPVLAAGCAGPEVQSDRYYRLATSVSDSAPGGPPLPGALLVQRFAADAVLSQRPIAWSAAESPHALQHYHYHLWADVPPRMLQLVAAETLRNAWIAEQVVTPDLRVRPDWELSANIRRLEHLRGPDGAVVVAIEFALIRSDDGALVLVRDYAVEVPVAADEVAAAVEAMGRAFGEILERLLADLAASG